jgi:NADH dehydrogenase FAD-containing subunit
MKGFLAFLLWRAAYWTEQVSIVNKILIPMYWFKAFLFGRDISRF